MVVKYDMQCHRLTSEMSKYLSWDLWIEFTFQSEYTYSSY